MGEAFGWLGQLMEALICIFPHREIVPSTHGGVRFRYGKDIPLPLGGSVIWYWPLVTKIQTYPINRQTCNLENQTLTTIDGKVIGLSGIVVFEVPDPHTFLTKVWDGEDTIRDIVLGNLSEYVETHTMEEFRQGFRAVKRKVRSALQGFGIHVVKVALSHNVECDRIIGLWPAGGESKSGSTKFYESTV
jgi:hypothetical protein